MSIRLRALSSIALAAVLLWGGMLPTGAVRSASAAEAEHSAPEAEDAEGGEHHESGAPMGFQQDLALWSLVTFIVFVLVLRTFAWGPLISALDKREANIRRQLAEAEAARQQAEQMLKKHAKQLEEVEQQVKSIIEEAKRDAERTKKDIVESAQREAQATQTRAIHEIERSRDQALQELFEAMSGQVALATEHVIGRSLSGEDQDRLINEALSQFASKG